MQLDPSPSPPYPYPYPHPRPYSSLLPTPYLTISSKKLENLNCIEQATPESGGLYLGDIICIVRGEILEKYAIGAVLSCLQENSNFSSNLCSSICRKVVPAKDDLLYPINQHFQECFQWIQAMRQAKKNVLVHCHAGVSRSATILCAYLMKKYQWTYDHAYLFLKQARNRVKPNDHFVKILREFQLQLQIGADKKGQRFSAQEVESRPFGKSYYIPTQSRISLNLQPSQSILSSIENQQRQPKKSIKKQQLQKTVSSSSIHQQTTPKKLTTTQSTNHLPTTQNLKISTTTLNPQNGCSITPTNLPTTSTISSTMASLPREPCPLSNEAMMNKVCKSVYEPMTEVKKKSDVMSVSFTSYSKGRENHDRQKQRKIFQTKRPASRRPGFGQDLKNKVSVQLGRKTRIPWELAEGMGKKQSIQYSNIQVSLNCF